VIVLDASAVTEVVLQSGMGSAIRQRLRTVRLVHAPHLVDIEVTNALRKQVLVGAVAPVRARQALEDFRAMRILRHRHAPYIARIWELRDNFTAYDACYLALAEGLDATLLTRDAAMRSAPLRRGQVEVI
jgi:predicted nucleic acid-binding protein